MRLFILYFQQILCDPGSFEFENWFELTDAEILRNDLSDDISLSGGIVSANCDEFSGTYDPIYVCNGVPYLKYLQITADEGKAISINIFLIHSESIPHSTDFHMSYVMTCRFYYIIPVRFLITNRLSAIFIIILNHFNNTYL